VALLAEKRRVSEVSTRQNGRWSKYRDPRADDLRARAVYGGEEIPVPTLEREANVFAAELLMPEEPVRASADDQNPAYSFGVSEWPCSCGFTASAPSISHQRRG
jgi:hypothetical protein